MNLNVLIRTVMFVAGCACTTLASATFHLVQITQVFSNADGSVQYIELAALAGAQQFIGGHTIRSTSGSSTRSFTFPADLPGDTAHGDGGYGMPSSYKSFLVATQGFAALNLVKPDYVVPNGFLFLTNGTIDYAESADVFVYASLPTTGGLALNRSGTTAVGAPLNFSGETARMPGTNAAVPAMALENPQPGSFQSGIGLISGWSCEGSTITVAIDGAAQRAVPYGSSRGDTAGICGAGTTNTGFGLLFNYNGLGTGNHTAQIFVNEQPRGNPTTFTVTAPAGEFLSGFSREITVPNFPVAGKTATLIWQEAQQNFAIKTVQ
jgi:hypothetical protein